jgi:hypothetical protein
MTVNDDDMDACSQALKFLKVEAGPDEAKRWATIARGLRAVARSRDEHDPVPAARATVRRVPSVVACAVREGLRAVRARSVDLLTWAAPIRAKA